MLFFSIQTSDGGCAYGADRSRVLLQIVSVSTLERVVIAIAST
jgi:hypothetical protein